MRGVPHAVAFQSVTGFFYCLLPVTLFLMAWLLTGAPGYSFLAGLFYSLTAPVQLIVPDESFSWTRFWEARRFYLTAVWDETPHFAALTFPWLCCFSRYPFESGGSATMPPPSS